MQGAQARLPLSANRKDEDPRVESQFRKQAFRAELYALAVLVGQGLVVVYVIGSLLVNCLRT